MGCSFSKSPKPLHITFHSPSCEICKDRRIFYVDDDEDNLLLFSKVLALQVPGAPPLMQSSDPLKATEIFEAHPYRYPMVILDYSMPEMNGNDLGKAIERVAKAHQAPTYTCILSAHVGDSGISFPLFMKPEGLGTLFQKIREIYQGEMEN